MDYTYFVAGFWGILIGFLASIFYAFLPLRVVHHQFIAAPLITFVIDGLTLYDWSAIVHDGAAFLAMDLTWVAVMSVIGCLIGAAPLLIIRGLMWSFRVLLPKPGDAGTP